LPCHHEDKLEEILKILRDQGAIIGAIAFCQELFGHQQIDKLTESEREELTILLREKMLEASMSSGQRLTPDRVTSRTCLSPNWPPAIQTGSARFSSSFGRTQAAKCRTKLRRLSTTFPSW
jgi:hypothetical protein